MGVFHSFELAAIELLAREILSEQQLAVLAQIELADSYSYTGSGYFLSVKLPDINCTPRTLSAPALYGRADDITAGFLVHLGNGYLTLECHTWGDRDVPEDFRQRDVRLSTL